MSKGCGSQMKELSMAGAETTKIKNKSIKLQSKV